MKVDTAVTLLLALIQSAQAVSATIAQARAAGRTELTPEEWSGILTADDAARDAVLTALQQATPGDPPAPAAPGAP